MPETNSQCVLEIGGPIKRDHVWSALDDLTQAWQRGLLPIQRFDWHRPENANYPSQVVDLFDYLGDVSWKLPTKHPLLYLQNVLNNFVSDTFDYNLPPPSTLETHDPHAPEGGSVVRDITFYTATVWINRIETPFLTAAYVILLAYVLFCPLLLLSRDRNDLLCGGAVVAIAVGTFATILCTCAVAAYFPEHGVPFMSVLVICAVLQAAIPNASSDFGVRQYKKSEFYAGVRCSLSERRSLEFLIGSSVTKTEFHACQSSEAPSSERQKYLGDRSVADPTIG